MVQNLNVERIQCPICNEEHDSQLVAFPKKVEYNGHTLMIADYYHSCPNRKEFFQTDKDINESFKLERTLKKQVDQQIQFQQQQNQQIPVGAVANINGVNMSWTGKEWVRI